jgi:glycosyltransferase involved in cell wall biosynthesis
MAETISVIIPCFNHAAYLEEALNSVLGQSYRLDEIIVVNDGSVDESAKIASRFAPGVQLFNQNNAGIGAARNTGIRAAQGSIIAFLDADDLWPKDSLQLRLDRLKQSAADAVVGLVEHFLSPELEPAIAAKLHCPVGQTIARFAGAMLVRRSVFDRIGYFDETLKVGEMMDWVARLGEAQIETVSADALVMRRRIHGANSVIRERSSHGDYLKALKASIDRRASNRPT